jgi:hypothetical protein
MGSFSTVACPLSVATGVKELGLVFWYRCWETGHVSHGPMARIGHCWKVDLMFWHSCWKTRISLGTPSLREPNKSRVRQSVRKHKWCQDLTGRKGVGEEFEFLCPPPLVLFKPSNRLDEDQSHWGYQTAYFTESTDSNLMWKHPHRHTQK